MFAGRVDPDGRTVDEWRSRGLWRISGYTIEEVDRMGGRRWSTRMTMRFCCAKIRTSSPDGRNEFGIDSDDEAVARAIISLAQALGLEVTAEGVETEAQFERARELGCHQVQGYYVTRPAPFDQILDTLQ